MPPRGKYWVDLQCFPLTDSALHTPYWRLLQHIPNLFESISLSLSIPLIQSLWRCYIAFLLWLALHLAFPWLYASFHARGSYLHSCRKWQHLAAVNAKLTLGDPPPSRWPRPIIFPETGLTDTGLWVWCAMRIVRASLWLKHTLLFSPWELSLHAPMIHSHLKVNEMLNWSVVPPESLESKNAHIVSGRGLSA